MSSLPPDIITNLLSRLPVKSLLRFRSVSKPWCAEIDSPDFIKLHLTHSIATSSKLSLIGKYDGSLYSVESETLENLTKIETPTDIMFNSCNGLLLLESHSQGFILFNVSTRKHISLPVHSPPPKKYGDVYSVQGCFNSLGYDVVNDDYKVFSIVVLVVGTNRFVACEARVYSLKSNTWHIVRDFAKGMTFDRLFDAYVNGAFHTVICDVPRRIVALDVGKEDISFIPMPNFKDKNVCRYTALAFDGRLGLLCWYLDDQTDIWLMNEYGVKESWNMLLSVKPEIPRIYVIPMVYSKSRTEVLLSYGCKKFVWYDLRKKTVRDFQVLALPIAFVPVVCVGSLVSVGGGKNDEKKKQQGVEETKEEKVKKKKKKRDDFLSKGFKLKL